MMNVLVATRDRQGEREGDCCGTVDGELVLVPGQECDRPGCGCNRGFAGLTSHRATTTCVVAERDIDLAGLQAALVESLAAGGWLTGTDGDAEAVDGAVREIVRIAHSFPVGTVLERDGPQVRAR